MGQAFALSNDGTRNLATSEAASRKILPSKDASHHHMLKGRILNKERSVDRGEKKEEEHN